MGAGEWLNEFGKVDKEEKVLLEKGVEGVRNRMMEKVGECLLYWLVGSSKEGSMVWLFDFGPPFITLNS